ncbi:MAG: hypothetical protein KatS3mg026_0009 [Bacteroidia bacterium]|nr:MAG: hypothetical protein KatS3mg026_0009 [Bacteroidia bacterium]
MQRLSRYAEVALIFGVTLAVRLYRLGEASLWTDEIFSWMVSHLTPGRIVAYLATGNNPPLWEMLLHFWRRGVGDTEEALRSLAALFNAGTAAGLYMWGRQVGGPWAGWTAGLLWTFSLLGQTIGREARVYALLSCLTVGAHLLFWRWVRTHKGFFLWLASLWALFHTHYMGGIVIAWQLGVLLVWWRKKPSRFLWVGGVLALMLALQGILLMDRLSRPSEIGYVSFASLESAYDMLRKFSNMPVPTVLAMSLLLAGTLLRLAHPARRSPEVTYIYLSFFVPFIGLWVAGTFLRIWNPRYLMPVAISYYVGLGVSLATLPLRWRIGAGSVVGLAWLLSWYPALPGDGVRHQEIGQLLQQKPPHQLLLVSPDYQAGILLYYPGDTTCTLLLKESVNPLSAGTECLAKHRRIRGVSFYGEIPPCELAATDTLWWLDYDICFSHPNTFLPELLWEEFQPIRCYSWEGKITLWVAVRRSALSLSHAKLPP